MVLQKYLNVDGSDASPERIIPFEYFVNNFVHVTYKASCGNEKILNQLIKVLKKLN